MSATALESLDAAWEDYQRNCRSKQMTPETVSNLASQLLAAKRWHHLAEAITDIFYLEARVAQGQVYDLASDFTVALNALPSDFPQRTLLSLLREAIQRTSDVINRQAADSPHVVFQSLWNIGWWHGDAALRSLLESWKVQKGRFCWLRSLRPPGLPLGSPLIRSLEFRSQVKDLGYAFDNCFVAILPDHNPVTLYKVISGAKVHTVHEWQKSDTMAVSPCGPTIALQIKYNITGIYDLHTGELRLEIQQQHSESCRELRFSRSGEWVAVVAMRKFVTIHDCRTGQTIATLAHPGEVYDAAFLAGDRLLATTGEKGQIKIWVVADGSEHLQFHHEKCREIVATPDGTSVITLGDGHLIIRDTETGTIGKQFAIPDSSVLALSPDGRWLATIDDYTTVTVWDIATETVIRRFPNANYITVIRFSPDGTQLATGSYEGHVRIWDLSHEGQYSMPDDHAHDIFVTAFGPDGTTLLTGSSDNTMRLWSADGTFIRSFVGHTRSVDGLGYMANGTEVVSRSRRDETGRYWNLATGECTRTTDARSVASAPVPYAQENAWFAKRYHCEVTDCASGKAIAWFPTRADNISRHPRQPLWAYNAGSHLELYALEGIAPSIVEAAAKIAEGQLEAVVEGLRGTVPALRAAAVTTICRWIANAKSDWKIQPENIFREPAKPPEPEPARGLVAAIRKMLTNPNRPSRERIVDPSRPARERIVGLLHEQIGDESVYIRCHAAWALIRLGDHADRTVRVLGSGLQSDQTAAVRTDGGSETIALLMLESLKSLKLKARAALPELIEAMDIPSGWERMYEFEQTAFIVYGIGEAAIPGLSIALNHTSITVRVGAAMTLGRLGFYTPHYVELVLPHLNKALTNDQPRVREHAAEWLQKIATKKN